MIRLILILLIMSSCIGVKTITDNDDLYFSGGVRIHPNNGTYSPYYNNPQFNYGWYNWNFYNPYTPFRYSPNTTIIVVPQKEYNYGKRPSREGNSNSGSIPHRRGRQ